MTVLAPEGPVVVAIPLYVDLDGTLIHTDLLWESLLSALRVSPIDAVAGLARLRHGKAAMKGALAQVCDIDVTVLPYNQPLLAWLQEQVDAGRPLWLATAADRGLAERVAQHLGIFKGVLASEGTHNLKGPNKLAAIRAHANGAAFAYCGNGPEDVEIFAAARQAIVVAASAQVLACARANGNVAAVFEVPPVSRPLAWLRALRLHQWLKNLLVFVPLFTAFRIDDGAAVAAAVLSFIAFGLVASGGYLVNDLLDLSADRQHPTKGRRPFASGVLSVPAGSMAAVVLFVAGLLLAATVSWEVAAWIAGYALLTLAYSLVIKRQAVFDLVALGALYTMRILAGGAAIEVQVSFWLLAFSGFLFFSLATIKRCGELVSLRDREVLAARGRGYQNTDLEVLKSLGTATSVGAVLVLALYVNAGDVAHRYASPRILWLVLGALLTWLAHLWMQTWRGNMHDDPLVFALRDPVSRWLVLAMLLGFGFAALLHF